MYIFHKEKIGLNNLMAFFLFLVLSLSMLCYEVDARNNIPPEIQHSVTRLQDLKNILPTDNEYDCVDMYKQPAFEHPLLKDHKIQLNPTFSRDRKQRRSSYTGRAFKVYNFTKGCRRGEVPIHRIKMIHQLNTTSLESEIEGFRQYSQGYPGHHFATLDTTQNMTYHGASALISVYNLSVQVNQYSLSQIWLRGGPPAELNSIQVGSGVHPSLYGDNQPRLTGYWTVDNYQTTGCFNVRCPGFVQVHPSIRFGEVLKPSSTIGSSDKYYFLVRVEQDQSTGHWWLTKQGDYDQEYDIGYWPKELFTHLREGSSLIRYGGETFAPRNMISPPMGSGKLPETLFRNSAFMGGLKFLDSQYNENDVNPKDMKPYCDASPNCYDLLYHGYEGQEFKQAFLFGGPGGQCGI